MLPKHLSVLVSGRQYIDVVGTAAPWPIPDGWWDRASARVRELITDPRVGTNQHWTGWPEDTPDVAPFLQNLAMSLGGYVAIFSGEYAQFPEQLIDDFLSPTQRREPLAARNWYLTDNEWPLFLIKYVPDEAVARRGALEVSRECTAFLSAIGPLHTRAAALLSVYDRILESSHLLEFHLTAPYPEIARLWRQSLLGDAERSALPEIGGWGAALHWSFSGLAAAHDHLSSVTGNAETMAEVVASMALCDHVELLPAALAVAAGPANFAAISTALEQRRPDFDPDAWLQQNRGWLARALLTGEVDTCRAWVAMAAQVSRVVAGLPGPPSPSTAPDTVGFVTDIEELFGARHAVNPLVGAIAALSEERRQVVVPITAARGNYTGTLSTVTPAD